MGKQALYQVVVETRDDRCLPVSPRAPRAFCETLAATLDRAIDTGRLAGWSNPTIVPVLSL